MGGGPKHVLGILSNIDRKIFELFLICPPGYLSAEGKLLPGVEVFNFNPRSKFDFIAVLQLHKIIHKILSSRDPFGPAIIHSHGPRAGLMARWASPSTAKMVYTEHRWDDDYHLKNPLNEMFQKKMLRKQNSKADLIIAVSSSVKKYLVNSGLASKEKIIVIPNGINFKDKNQPLTSHRADKSQVIGTIGNLNFQKGHSYLIDAMPSILKKYPLATLEIIGEGEDRPALEDQINKLKLGKQITLLGHKNIINKYLKYWSVFVLSSVAETFGIVVLEAMQAGVPVVATKVGGVPDIITNEKNGLLISSHNPKAIADAVISLLDRPAMAAKFKREGLNRVKDFDWKKVIKLLEAEYTKLFE
jgi:glycosyltransferase involved in cell wall biosynthesis